MLLFDAGSREKCLARRQSTNTPLQALVLLNDPVFVECAQALHGTELLQQPRPASRSEARHVVEY